MGIKGRVILNIKDIYGGWNIELKDTLSRIEEKGLKLIINEGKAKILDGNLTILTTVRRNTFLKLCDVMGSSNNKFKLLA